MAVNVKETRKVVSEFVGVFRPFQHLRCVRVAPKEMVEAGEVMHRLLDEIEQLQGEVERLQRRPAPRFAERMAAR